MSRHIRVGFYELLMVILFYQCTLSACNIKSEEETNDELSTSVAKTIQSNALQYTLQAQQAQLTNMAQTLEAPQQPAATQPPQQPSPQAVSPSPDSSQGTTQAINSILNTIGVNASPVLIYGAKSGRLVHDPSDGMLAYECASISVQNFLAQLNFSPPYPSSVGDWDLGLLFRAQTKGNYRLAMFIGKQWELEYYRKDTDSLIPVSKGNIPNLKTDQGDDNLIQIVGMDNQGWLLVNGVQSGKFDLSDLVESGDICIALGFYKNTEITGKETEYTAFSVWELR